MIDEMRSQHYTAVEDGDTHLELAAVSDRGPVRSENQDAWAILPLDPHPGVALVLADGMGGHADGAISSYLAVQNVSRYLSESVDPHAAFQEAVQRANLAIAQHRDAAGAGMTGTTLVAAVISTGRISIVNVGDSRAYLIRQGVAQQLTQDHSWVAEQARAGVLDPNADYSRHPERSLLTRALTGSPVTADMFTAQLALGDLLVLCSDGLWDPLDDHRLGEIFGPAEQPLDALVARACDGAIAAGATDNVTVVACRALPAEVKP